MGYGTSVTLELPFADAVGRSAPPWPSRDSAFSPRSTPPLCCKPGSACRPRTIASWLTEDLDGPN